MEDIEQLWAYDTGQVNGSRAVVEPCRKPSPSPRPRRNILEPVSYSTALNEHDRGYRGGMTMRTGADLARIRNEELMEMGREFRAAEAEDLPLFVLAQMEQGITGYGACGQVLVRQFMVDDIYGRW
ncbi:hypothetical protein [Amycolatopsis sp. lyj-23]|uniref:hypothetical protein n=1 Tax=Amycolatopsis sp. lyj-23 TaxID=2789283 RepID=UPI003978E86F